MTENTAKIDGQAVHRDAVERGGELGEAAVAHAQAVKDALALPDAPVSPHAPPPYPAPPYPAPPYPAPAVPTPEAKAEAQADEVPPIAGQEPGPAEGAPVEPSLDAPEASPDTE